MQAIRAIDHHASIGVDLDDICRRAATELTAFSGKSILITGGAGFLGYYLVQALLRWNADRTAEQRAHVTVFDSYIRGVPRWLADLEGDRDLDLVSHDITGPLPADLTRFDYVIHAASIASPTYYRQHPLETMDTNVNGLRRLLDYARQRHDEGRPLEGLLYFSTSEIYGDPPPEHIPTSEEFRGHVSCTGPRACYDESKRYGETLSVTFAARYGVPVKIVRPFNNYGPGLRLTDRRVVPDFARNILSGSDIVLLSDGLPTRTFCYVADAVVGYFKVLVRGRSGEAYNIGADEPEISISELAQRMVVIGRTVCGYQGSLVRGVDDDTRYLVDNPQRRCPSIRKARTELGFAPTIGLDEGLERTLRWYLDLGGEEEAR